MFASSCKQGIGFWLTSMPRL